MFPFTVIAAIGVAAVLVQHGVIDHLPHAAAHQIIVLVDLLPVGLRVAGADAHGVRILAHEIGAIVEWFLPAAMFAHIMHHLHRRIHFAAHIVGNALAMHGALIMHGQVRVLMQVLRHGVGVVVAARLIAQAPHKDAGVAVNLVALIQAGNAVDVARLPLHIMADGVIGAGDLHGKGRMGLKVVLIHDVDTQLVRQLDQQRIRRIVAGTDGIYVVRLAD